MSFHVFVLVGAGFILIDLGLLGLNVCGDTLTSCLRMGT